MRGEGPERQADGSAGSGRGDILDGYRETLILGHGKKVAKFRFSIGEICGEFLRRNFRACFAHI